MRSPINDIIIFKMIFLLITILYSYIVVLYSQNIMFQCYAEIPNANILSVLWEQTGIEVQNSVWFRAVLKRVMVISLRTHRAGEVSTPKPKLLKNLLLESTVHCGTADFSFYFYTFFAKNTKWIPQFYIILQSILFSYTMKRKSSIEIRVFQFSPVN